MDDSDLYPKLNILRLIELKNICRTLKLPQTGNKRDIIRTIENRYEVYYLYYLDN